MEELKEYFLSYFKTRHELGRIVDNLLDKYCFKGFNYSYFIKQEIEARNLLEKLYNKRVAK